MRTSLDRVGGVQTRRVDGASDVADMYAPAADQAALDELGFGGPDDRGWVPRG